MSLLTRFKSLFTARSSAADDTSAEGPTAWYRHLLRNTVVLAAVVIFGLLVLASLVVSSEPDLFDVRALHETRMRELERSPVPGSMTTATLIQVASTLLEKPGGYLSNDVMPPGVWVDNMPNWEFGVLVQVRDISKVMRENFSRSQSQSAEDPDLIIAEPGFNFPNDSWIFPASESQYREAIEAMESYLLRLSDPERPQAEFFTRADNLNAWLGNVESRLGSLSQRLGASVTRTLSTDTPDMRSRPAKTPWHQRDDIFYEARGAAWALLHLLRAVEADFADVIANKNAQASVEQIIRELEATQSFIFSPVILNGDGFGFVANHSLVMASYISRANAAIIDLRLLLQQG